MKADAISLKSEIFTEFRQNMDAMLGMLISQMKQKELSEGTLMGKVKVKMFTKATDDGEVINQLVIEPDVSMKLGAKGKIECGTKSGIFMKLDQNGYPIIGENQISIDELLGETQRGA